MANEPQALAESVEALRELISQVHTIGAEAKRIESHLKATAEAVEADLHPTPLRQMARVVRISVTFLTQDRRATQAERTFAQTDVTLLYGRLWVEWGGGTWVLEATDNPLRWYALETPLPEMQGPLDDLPLIPSPEVRTVHRIRHYGVSTHWQDAGRIVGMDMTVESKPVDWTEVDGERTPIHQGIDGHRYYLDDPFVSDGDTIFHARRIWQEGERGPSVKVCVIRPWSTCERVIEYIPMNDITRKEDGVQSEFWVNYHGEECKMEMPPLRPAKDPVYSITLSEPPHPALAHPTIRLLLQTLTIEGITIDEEMVTVPTGKLQETPDMYGRAQHMYVDEQGREYQVELRKWNEDEDGFEEADLPGLVHQAVRLQPAGER